MGERIVVGMSGGVDSSVAALALREAGWDVVGVTLHLWDYAKEGHAGRCCAPEDQYDAARVSAALGVPHYTFDRRALFREKVVERFVNDYVEGRTPSPCVRCNESVKLGPLYQIARRLGAKRVATGHYARIESEGDGISLRAAIDRDKDQSYFLWAAPLDALRALVLPLGGWTKPEARAFAERHGLPNAAKPDSTDLCFVEGDNYASFVTEHASALGPAGTIETPDGRVVGTHQGVHGFTVGQRRGLGAGGAPRYVLKILPERAAVIVGTDDEARVDTMTVADARWLVTDPPETVTVKVRYRHPGVRAQVLDSRANPLALRFESPQRGVAPGQAAVMYDGDRVVGGGWIA
jgi:tRNA-specific 2-thiouridylase